LSFRATSLKANCLEKPLKIRLLHPMNKNRTDERHSILLRLSFKDDRDELE